MNINLFLNQWQGKKSKNETAKKKKKESDSALQTVDTTGDELLYSPGEIITLV